MSGANFDNYEKLEKIADGQYASVCVYKKPNSNKSYAGKEINLNLYTNFKTEKQILEKHADDNQNVVHYFDVVYSKCDTYALLLMELCDGTVQQYVDNKPFVPARDSNHPEMTAKEYFSDITPLEITRQAAKGVLYLHEKCNLIHRDIKPTNFLMVRIKGVTLVKIADFDLSRELNPSESGLFSYSESNQIAYQPYEINESKFKTRKSLDIFSLGVFIHFVLTDGCFPFGNDEPQQKHNICNKMTPKLHHLKCNLTLELTKEETVTASALVTQMINHKCDDRPTIAEVSCHPLFWDSKRKLEFYKDAKNHLDKKILTQSQDYYLNYFNKSLLIEKSKEEYKKFKISYKILHPLLRKSKQIGKCSNVVDLLVIIRNQKEHIQDADYDKKLAELLGYDATKNTVDWDVFLDVLTKDIPQLLVHLYEYFRYINAAWDFYPSTKRELLTPTKNKPNVNKDLPSTSEQGNSATFTGFCDIIIDCKGSEVQNLGEVDLNHEITIKFSPNQDQQINTFLLPKSNNNAVKSVLGGCKDGFTLKRKENSIILKRNCLAYIYFLDFIDEKKVIKVEKDLTEEIFCLDKFLAKNMHSRPKIKIAIGTLPKKAVVSIIINPKI